MSILVSNTIKELELMAAEIGILGSIKGTKKSGGFKKDDLVISIRDKLLQDKYSGGSIPDHIRLLQKIKSPMLSKRIDEFKKDFQDEIWSDENWDLEEKVNGVRCIVIKNSCGIFFFSRECSRKTLLPIEMPIQVKSDFNGIKDFIIDCEVTSENSDTCMHLSEHGISASNNTQALEMLLVSMNHIMSYRLQSLYDFNIVFNAFDCLYYDGSWIIDEKLSKRREILNLLYKDIVQRNFPIRLVNHSNEDKKRFYSKCLVSGFEGCIAKRLDSIYIPDSVRNSKGWVKIKNVSKIQRDIPSIDDLFNSRRGNVNLDGVSVGDTVDAFITGFTPGVRGTLSENLIYSVDVSVYVFNSISQDYEERKLCTVCHIDAATRDLMSRVVGGAVTLNPVCYNSVVELDANCNMVLRLRYDKSSRDCIMEESTYNQILSSKQ